MGIVRYYTVGAVVPDVRSLEGLSLVVVLARRRDERLARVLLPEARVQNAESGLSRRQWIELASTFFSASTKEASFPAGFALLLATMPEEDFDEGQGAFLEDDALLSPLAVDRRPVVL